MVWYIEGTRGTHKPKSKLERTAHLIGKLLGRPDKVQRDSTRLLPTRSTLARALAKMDQEQLDEVLCVPTSVYYGKERRLKDFFRPIMLIGMPFRATNDPAHNKIEQTERLQACRTQAITLYNDRKEKKSFKKIRSEM